MSGVIVVGGGIAGMAAAVRLAERGVAVTLLETRKKLGGRATSFLDTRSGKVLDNCQHVVLGCCTNYLDLLRRLGVADKIAWHNEQYWIEEGGRISVIKPCGLPAPFHFTRSILGAGFLSKREVIALGRAAAAILRVDRAKFQGITFGDFLRRRRQPDRLIRRFWSPVVVSACNLDVDRVSASAALHVFQQGFFAARDGAMIGVPSVPLVELYEQAESLITGAGGRVIFGAGVACMDETSAMTTSGERYSVDKGGSVVCAVPVERVNRIVSEEIQQRDPRFAPLDTFTHSPILGVHLKFDRPVLETPHAVLVDRPTQWLFRKDEGGRYIQAVISAADDWVALSEDDIAARVLADIHACIPASIAAKLESARAIKEKLATFAPLPGTDALRPAATSPHSTLILAGDYTATGWPATMEGATRSGYAAAAAALGEPPESMLIPALKPERLARALGLK